MKHTPGPWTIHSNGHLRQLDPFGKNHIPQNDADKRLIAAAPDLLAALKLVSGALPPQCAVTLDIVRRAIAQAEGES
jgi:hypothetical protein